MKTELKTSRLTLRPIATSDLVTTHAYASDRENTRYMMFLPNESEAETLDFLTECEAEWESETQTLFEFAVISEGRHIGGVSLTLGSEKAGELGWIIADGYQGRGFASEAASALIGFARTLGVRRLSAHCDAENAASRRVMEKLGMRFVSMCGGRKNRSSAEERRELTYELALPDHVRITAVKAVRHDDLIGKYENPLDDECDVSVGKVFLSYGKRPDALCAEAWRAMEPFVKKLLLGGGDFFDGWMKDPRSAMVSCSDGFRPVSFYVEAVD